MGCGVSKADLRSASFTEVQRHPSDLGLEYLELVPAGLLPFDDTFNQVETVLNHLIELNNDVNDCIADVKSAYASCVGGMTLEVAAGCPDCDWVLLDVLTADGRSRPNPIDLRSTLISDSALREADEAMQQAYTDLLTTLVSAARPVQEPTSSMSPGTLPMQMTHSNSIPEHNANGNVSQDQRPSHIHLLLSDDGQQVLCQPDVPQVARFNQQLQQFRHCLGSKFFVKVSVKHCRSPGTPTIRARIVKPAPSNDLQVTGWSVALASEHVPATPLDIACIEMDGAVDIIKAAESALLSKTQWLSAKTRELASVQWQVLRKHKVTLALVIPDAERRTLIRKALVDTNAALYSLSCCTASPDGQGTLAGAVGEVARQLCLVLRKRWENRGGLPMPLKRLLTVTTNLSFKDAGVFEFSVHAEALPEAQLGIFPSCLPIPGQELLARIEMLSATIANALRQLPNISAQIEQLTEHARVFIDMVPEVAAQKGLPMMEAVKAGKAVGTNLDMLFSSERLFHAFAMNVKRVADDLAMAQQEVDKVIGVQAAEGGPASARTSHHV